MGVAEGYKTGAAEGLADTASGVGVGISTTIEEDEVGVERGLLEEVPVQ